MCRPNNQNTCDVINGRFLISFSRTTKTWRTSHHHPSIPESKKRSTDSKKSRWNLRDLADPDSEAETSWTRVSCPGGHRDLRRDEGRNRPRLPIHLTVSWPNSWLKRKGKQLTVTDIKVVVAADVLFLKVCFRSSKTDILNTFNMPLCCEIYKSLTL